jgi:aminoglycoside phosphotransferase (APT) family kinase protein
MNDLSLLDPATLPRIGMGASAEVFALPEGLALKLFHPGLSDAAPQRELAASRVAHEAGLPVPAPRGTVELAERHGLVFERLREHRLARRLRRWPGAVMVTLAAMARRHAALHEVPVTGAALPTVHQVLAARIADSAAPPAAIAAAQAALSALPHRDRLAHGDLHLGNIMGAGARLVLIDWAQAMAGDPAADIARSELVMRFGRYGPLLRRWRWPRLARHAAAAWYLRCYRRRTGMNEAAIDAWRLPVAVAWWREGSAAHLPALADYVAARLARDAVARFGAEPAAPGRDS